MLLLFHIGENLYGIDTAKVIEILPMMLLRKVQPTPDYLAGVFNYHGSLVPVVDLCCLIHGKSCQICYSTRVILVDYSTASEPSVREQRSQRRLGLMAERVTETLKVSNEQLQTAERISNSPLLGKLLIDERGMIQTVNWEYLVTDADQIKEWLGDSGQIHGTGHSTEYN